MLGCNARVAMFDNADTTGNLKCNFIYMVAYIYAHEFSRNFTPTSSRENEI